MIRSWFSILILLLTLRTEIVLAQDARAQATAAMNELEKSYFDKGLSAAKLQAWDEAFANFKLALGSTPEHAPVYFNLGVVFENLGAPLEAAACLQAYLALSPNALNAEAVRQEIATLANRRAAQIDEIFRHATDIVPKLVENAAFNEKNDAYFAIASSYARAGQIGKAIDLVKSMKRDKNNPIDRVPDLRIPDPWFEYAATLLGYWKFFSPDSNYLKETQGLLDHLAGIFPIPALINNPSDPIGTKIDGVFKERSAKIAALRESLTNARSGLSSVATNRNAAISPDAERHVRYSNSLIDRAGDPKGGIDRSSFDLEANIKAAVDPSNEKFQKYRSWYRSPEYITAQFMVEVAERSGSDLFLFRLLQRGTAGVTDAVEGPEAEEALWKSVQDTRIPELFLVFSAWFPRGKYAELAELSAKKLQIESKLAPTAQTAETVSIEKAMQLGDEALKLQNYTEAMRWLRSAADRGNAAAQASLGSMYDNGEGVKEDKKEARQWYRKAADQGNPDGEFGVGSTYYIGGDREEAVRWYRKAADNGHSYAQVHLCEIYRETQDYSEAAKWCLQASSRFGRAKYFLGEFYEKGLGVKKDLSRAAYWYKLVADSNDYIYGDDALKALKRIGAR